MLASLQVPPPGLADSGCLPSTPVLSPLIEKKTKKKTESTLHTQTNTPPTKGVVALCDVTKGKCSRARFWLLTNSSERRCHHKTLDKLLIILIIIYLICVSQ